jgi:hypothetical protein
MGATDIRRAGCLLFPLDVVSNTLNNPALTADNHLHGRRRETGFTHSKIALLYSVRQ